MNLNHRDFLSAEHRTAWNDRQRRTGRNIDYRKLPAHRVGTGRIPREFQLFFEDRVAPRLAFRGYKVPAKRRLALRLVHSLLSAGLLNGVVADGRNCRQPGVRARIEVWSALKQAELCDIALGSEQSGMDSRYRATRLLLRLREEWELSELEDLQLSRGTEFGPPTSRALVVLNSGKTDESGRPLPRDKQKRPLSIRAALEERSKGEADPKSFVAVYLELFDTTAYWIELINARNLDFGWKAQVADEESGALRSVPINVCLRQVHGGALGRAVGLHSWGVFSGQRLPKAVRKTITISGEPSAELDFSGCMPRLLKHRLGIDCGGGDIYAPDQIVPTFWRSASANQKTVLRHFLKKATNVCLNVHSRAAANSSVSKLVHDHPDRELFRRALSVEKTDPVGIVDRIVQVHRDIESCMFNESGLVLMTLTGLLMLFILSDLVIDAGCPVLAIHDSLLVRRSDVDLAEKTMRENYRRLTRGFEPVIQRVF